MSTAMAWPRVPISKVAHIASGNSIPAADRRGKFSSANVVGRPFISTKDVSLDGRVEMNTDVAIPETHSASFRLASAGSTLVCAEGGSAGRKVGWLPESAHFGNKLFAVSASRDLDPRFLFYFHQTDDFAEQFAGHLAGLIGGVSLNKFKTIEIPVPPLDEQRRIVAVLDQAFVALDRARTLAEANLADAEGFFASFIEAELEKSGGAVLTLQQMLDAGMILSHLDGNHGENYPRKEEFVEAGVPYVSANCIKDGQIDLTLAKFLSEDRAASFRKGVAQDGDVIFAHNATVGPVAILRTEEPKIILSTSVTYYRPCRKSILPEFLMYEMRSSAFKKQYEAVMKQATRNQVPITAQRKLSHTIPDMAAQQQVVAAAIELEGRSRSLVELYSKQIAEINEVRASLLQKAFVGELT